MIPISLKPKRFPAALGNSRVLKNGNMSGFMKIRGLTSAIGHGWKGWERMAPFATLRFSSSLPTNNSTHTYAIKAGDVSAFSTGRSKMQPAVEEDQEFAWVSPEKSKKTISTATSVKAPQSVVNIKPIVVEPKASLKLHGARESAWYTGKQPVHGQCPGVEADGRLYSLPHLTFQANLQGTTLAAEAARIRKSLQDYFDNTWTLTEVLLSSLQGEEAFQRPPYHDLRHPMIFYYGHPAALYVNKLRVAGLLDQPINAYFEVIFETGVDEMSWDDLSKNQMAWPAVAEVHAYRQQVYDTVTALIARLTDAQCLGINQDSPLWALALAFEHERIHLETSSFLISELPLEHVRFPEGLPSYHPSAQVSQNASTAAALQNKKLPVAGVDYPENKMISVPETAVTLGKSRDFPSFGWDNEYGQRSFTVPAFRASAFKVSNGEFLEFMQDGGYARNELWTATGWEWRAFRNVKMPTHFVRTGPQGGHEYVLRLLFDQTTGVPWDWPVVVNLHEATAFAKWKSLKTGKAFRVMTELEHRAIRDDVHDCNTVHGDHAAVLGGNAMMQKAGYNTNLACSSMSPVNALPPNSKGFHDVFGNAWEWTQDFFCALPGFKVHPYYEDFSTPCFDGLHHVIQGGSFMSTGNECSVHSRFHFRPHFYQHASFRVVEMQTAHDAVLTSDTDAPGPYVGAYPFRRSQLAARELSAKANADQVLAVRNNELLKHFAPSPLHAGGQSVMAAFAERIVQLARRSHVTLQGAKVLEVGSGPGGLTFALAAHCGTGASVIGVDHNAHATEVARKLFQGDTVEAVLPGEGATQSALNVTVPKSGALVQFRTADPMCLPAEMLGFDTVVLHDVLDTLASPNALLGRLGGVRGLVRSGGLLVVSSAYQWKEERTPKDLWLGGQEGAAAAKSAEVLVERLQEDFAHLVTEPMQQVWPEGQAQLRGAVYTVSYFLRK